MIIHLEFGFSKDTKNRRSIKSENIIELIMDMKCDYSLNKVIFIYIRLVTTYLGIAIFSQTAFLIFILRISA